MAPTSKFTAGRLASVGAVAGAGLLLLSACAGGSTGGSGGSSQGSGGGSGTSASAAGAGPGTNVTVKETEYHLALSQSGFKAGTYTFKAEDQGTVSHALAINGPGVSTQQTSTVSPGGSTDLTVTLQKGTYQLYCPIPGHRQLGMQTTIKVM